MGHATRTVASAGAELFVAEHPRPGAPTIVLVHGYPDTHSVWDELAEALGERFHIAAYDVRGMGGSSAPERRGAFALPELGRDLKAVIAAVSPDRPVHLVGHDWGAFQCWEGVTAGGLDGLVASFTAIAGPRIDLSRAWLRSRLRPSPTAVAQLASQLRRSWYVAWFQVPSLPELVLDIAVERAWPAVMRRREGIEPRPGHPAPTLARDVRTGIALYRTNLPILARRTAAPRAEIPVQLIVPTLDRYISTAMYEDAAGWAARIRVREVRAGHWVQRSHPKIVAAYIEEFVAAEPGRH